MVVTFEDEFDDNGRERSINEKKKKNYLTNRKTKNKSKEKRKIK